MMKNLLTLIALCAVLFFSSNPLQAQSPCLEDLECSADAGTPSTPSDAVCLNLDGNFDAAALGFDADPSFAVEDFAYEYVITDADGFILGVTTDGVVDMSAFEEGSYGLVGFIFCQSELDAITGNAIVGSLLGTSGGETLAEVLQLVDESGLVADGLTVEGVTGVLETAATFVGFTPCVGVAGTTVSVEVVAECAATCDASFGTPSAPDNLFYCAGAITDEFTTEGAAGDGYTTFWVITQGEDLSIVAASLEGAIDLGGDADLAPGTYTVHTASIQSDQLGNLALDLETGTIVTAGDFLALVEDEIYCAAVQVEGYSLTVSGYGSYGDVTYFETSSVCGGEGAATDAITIEGAAEDGFTTALVITSGDGLDIVNVSLAEVPNGSYSIDLSGLDAGDYTVHAFSFPSGQLDFIVDAITSGAVTTGVEVAGLIEAGAICGDLDVTGAALTILSADDPECLDDPCVETPASIALGAGVEAEYAVCPDGGVDFTADADFGPDENGAVFWIVTSVDPMGDVFSVSEDNTVATFLSGEGGGFGFTSAAYGGGNSMVWVTAVNVNIITDDTGVTIATATCQVETASVAVTLLTEEDCVEPCPAMGGTIATADETTVCVGGDETITVDVTAEGMGTNFAYLVTDGTGTTILDGPVPGPEFAFGEAPAGTCQIWAVWFEDDINIPDDQVANITGCFALSNPIDVNRIECEPDCEPGLAGASVSTDVVCADGVFTASASSNSGFVVAFALTSGGASTPIIGLSLEGTFDASDLAPGTYTVHAASIAAADALAAQDAIVLGETTGLDVAGLVADGAICAELDVAGIEVTVLEPIAITVNSVECDEAAEAFTVSVTLSGGLPAYDDEFTYQVFGSLADEISADDATFTYIGNAGESYNFEVSDGFCAAAILDAPTVDCKPCETDAGEMVDGTEDEVIVVFGDCYTGMTEGEQLDSVSVLNYILHTGADAAAGDIIACNDTGEFCYDDLASSGPDDDVTGDPCTQYFISAMVGPDNDGDGKADLLDECTVVNPGTPVVFLDPIVLTPTLDCDDDTGEGTVTVEIEGGLPCYDEDAVYTVEGTFVLSTEFEPGEPVVFTGDDGSFWEVIVSDAAGSQGYASDSISCEKENAVSWVAFTGEVLDAGNALDWTTALEINNDHFLVERSIDGTTFDVIATIEGAGNKSDESNYSFLDASAPAGLAYYRITQVDYDGTSSSTEVITLSRTSVSFGITTTAPVPATTDVDVFFNAVNNSTISVNLYDITGKLVTAAQVNAQTGMNTVNMNLSDYANGIYFITITDGVNVATERIVKN